MAPAINADIEKDVILFETYDLYLFCNSVYMSIDTDSYWGAPTILGGRCVQRRQVVAGAPRGVRGNHRCPREAALPCTAASPRPEAERSPCPGDHRARGVGELQARPLRARLALQRACANINERPSPEMPALLS